MENMRLGLAESAFIMCIGLYLVVISIGDLTSGIRMSPIGGIVGLIAGAIAVAAGALIVLWIEKEYYAEALGALSMGIALANLMTARHWGLLMSIHMMLYIVAIAVMIIAIVIRLTYLRRRR